MFDTHIETMQRDAMSALQLERLRTTVERCYHHIPVYRGRMDECGVTPDGIRTLDDIAKLPFTTKDDLRQNYPFGLLSVPMDDVVRVHASSGTTGKPTVVAYTRGDLDMWTDCVARLVAMAGVTRGDVAQISFGYGLFTGALGLHQGLERIGASVIPMSSGQTEKQLMLMQDFGTTVLVATPSYAVYLGEAIRDGNVPLETLKLRVGLFGAEGTTDEMRRLIEETLGLTATENYGLSEIIGPGVSGECLCRCGMHINEDHFYPEIVHPDTGEVLPTGSTGELVITTLTKEGLPMLRYRTRDITSLNYDTCACGRTLVRMNKIVGRTDDMLIIHGVNLFPSQIAYALSQISEVSPHFLIELDESASRNSITVVTELDDASVLESFTELEKLEKRIKSKLHSVTGLNMKVQIVAPRTMDRSMGKSQRIKRINAENK